MGTKTTAPDPARLYVALDGFVMPDPAGGPEIAVPEDMRLLGSHVAVRTHPELFVADPATSDDDAGAAEVVHRAKIAYRAAVLDRASGPAR